MKNYGAAENRGRDVLWDSIQRGLECCGVQSWEEWEVFNITGGPVPDSCCIKEKKSCGMILAAENFHTQGCYDIVINFLSDGLKIFFFTTIVIIVHAYVLAIQY